MNEAPPISHSDTDPQAWFAAVIEELFNDVIRNMTSVPGPQTADGIHQTRVAIRRFRSAVRDLRHNVDTEGFAPLQKQLKKIAARMGAVRDEDVFIEGLTKIAGDNEVPAAIQQRLDRSQQKREKAFNKLATALERTSPGELSQLFEIAVQSTFDAPEAVWPDNVSAAGSDMICRRLADLTNDSEAIYDPSDNKGIHKLRITAKRLRYTTDLYVTVFSNELQVFVDEIAELQSFLGDTHDYDLWIGYLSRQLKKASLSEAEPLERKDLARVLAKLVRKRAKKYASALKLLTKWQASGRFDEVLTMIGTADKDPAPFS